MVAVSCRTAKDYQKLPVALPNSFSDTTNNTDVDSGISGISWKAFYNNEELVQLIDTALALNYDLNVAYRRVEEAEAYAKQARLNWLPSINANVSASTLNPSENSLTGLSLKNFLGREHIEDYNASVGLSWEVDIWGKIRKQKKAALANYLYTKEASRAIQTRLVSEVARSFYRLLMLDEQLKVSIANKQLSDTLVQMMQLQKQAGLITELGVQQTTFQNQTFALLISELKQKISVEENYQAILLGKLPGAITRSAKLIDQVVSDTLSAGVPVKVLSNRPEVKASEQNLEAANFRVGMARANLYPSLLINASGGLNAFEASKWLVAPASLFGTVAGGLTQPIFQRRLLKTNLEVAIIRRKEAELQFRQTVVQAFGEVRNALVSLDRLNEREQIVRAQVDLQLNAVQNAKYLFAGGLANYLEVITAQSNLIQTELTSADIKYQQLIAKVELYRALGGGWK